VINWKIKEPAADWPISIENTDVPELPEVVHEGEAFITLINHATELIHIADLTLLTDPIFSKRASGFSWIGPKRVRPPAASISALPKVDVVLISHNHYDHMDIPSLKEIEKIWQPLFIVPLGNKKTLFRQGIKRVVELDWWEEYRLDSKNSIVMTPAQHWSGRGLFDHRKSLWGSFVIFSEKIKIFFGGDTGYSSHFKEIKNRYGKMDISLLPIGAFAPRWFMKQNHMNPEEAVQAYLDLESEYGLGMHYETFHLANESIDEPVKLLQEHLETLPEGRIKSFDAQITGKTMHYKVL